MRRDYLKPILMRLDPPKKLWYSDTIYGKPQHLTLEEIEAAMAKKKSSDEKKGEQKKWLDNVYYYPEDEEKFKLIARSPDDEDITEEELTEGLRLLQENVVIRRTESCGYILCLMQGKKLPPLKAPFGGTIYFEDRKTDAKYIFSIQDGINGRISVDCDGKDQEGFVQLLPHTPHQKELNGFEFKDESIRSQVAYSVADLKCGVLKDTHFFLPYLHIPKELYASEHELLLSTNYGREFTWNGKECLFNRQTREIINPQFYQHRKDLSIVFYPPWGGMEIFNIALSRVLQEDPANPFLEIRTGNTVEFSILFGQIQKAYREVDYRTLVVFDYQHRKLPNYKIITLDFIGKKINKVIAKKLKNSSTETKSDSQETKSVIETSTHEIEQLLRLITGIETQAILKEELIILKFPNIETANKETEVVLSAIKTIMNNKETPTLNKQADQLLITLKYNPELIKGLRAYIISILNQYTLKKFNVQSQWEWNVKSNHVRLTVPFSHYEITFSLYKIFLDLIKLNKHSLDCAIYFLCNDFMSITIHYLNHRFLQEVITAFQAPKIFDPAKTLVPVYNLKKPEFIWVAENLEAKPKPISIELLPQYLHEIRTKNGVPSTIKPWDDNFYYHQDQLELLQKLTTFFNKSVSEEELEQGLALIQKSIVIRWINSNCGFGTFVLPNCKLPAKLRFPFAGLFFLDSHISDYGLSIYEDKELNCSGDGQYANCFSSLASHAPSTENSGYYRFDPALQTEDIVIANADFTFGALSHKKIAVPFVELLYSLETKDHEQMLAIDYESIYWQTREMRDPSLFQRSTGHPINPVYYYFHYDVTFCIFPPYSGFEVFNQDHSTLSSYKEGIFFKEKYLNEANSTAEFVVTIPEVLENLKHSKCKFFSAINRNQLENQIPTDDPIVVKNIIHNLIKQYHTQPPNITEFKESKELDVIPSKIDFEEMVNLLSLVTGFNSWHSYRDKIYRRTSWNLASDKDIHKVIGMLKTIVSNKNSVTIKQDGKFISILIDFRPRVFAELKKHLLSTLNNYLQLAFGITARWEYYYSNSEKKTSFNLYLSPNSNPQHSLIYDLFETFSYYLRSNQKKTIWLRCIPNQLVLTVSNPCHTFFNHLLTDIKNAKHLIMTNDTDNLLVQSMSKIFSSENNNSAPSDTNVTLIPISLT